MLAPEINAAAISAVDPPRHRGGAARRAPAAAARWCITWAAKPQALAQARANIDAWTRDSTATARRHPDHGLGLRHHGQGLRLHAAQRPGLCRKAARISALAKDITEYLAGLPLQPAPTPQRLTVAYHAACSLQHGQRVTRQPKELLTKLGFAVKDVPDGHLCCGSAGTYNILQPDIARRLRERKVGTIERLRPDVIAAGNIGCITQIAAGTDLPVVHTVELIDWATGGPCPPTLRAQPRATMRPSAGALSWARLAAAMLVLE